MMNLKNIFLSLTLFMLSAAGLAAIDLAPKFTEGESFSYDELIDISMVQQIPGPNMCDINYQGAIQAQLQMDVEKVHEDGSADVKATLQDVQVKFSAACEKNDSPMNFNFSFDSTQEGEDEMPEIQVGRNALECFKKASFLIKFSPQGDVLGIEGIGKFADNLRNKLEDGRLVPQGACEEIAAIITPQISQMIEKASWHYLPGRPVNVGDSWENTVAFEKLEATRRYTLESADNARIVIKETSTPNITDKDTAEIFKSFEVKESGTIVLNSRDLWPISEESLVEFEGKQALPTPMSDTPLEIEYTLKLKTSSTRR